MTIEVMTPFRGLTVNELRVIEKETRGYPTGYLQAQSGTVKYDREHHELK